MKLLVRSADYGMLDCVTDGTLKVLRDGILTDLTFITNNPSAFRAAEEIKKYPQISIGQEINFMTGVPISDPKKIPSLVNEEGWFISSKERQRQKAFNISYEEALEEADRQVQRFIELLGRKPSYISGHSFGTPESRLAIADIAEKYDVLIGGNTHPKLQNDEPDWHKTVTGNKAAYTAEIQKDIDVEAWLIEDRRHLLDREYGTIDTHVGYCDEELYRMSSYSVIRAKEMYALCSPRFKEWVEKNQVELINFDQFKAENVFEDTRAKFLAPKKGWSEPRKEEK
jgi:predicted glycoside hydrolase/deacetylase ChbG (UPF0249 family)